MGEHRVEQAERVLHLDSVVQQCIARDGARFEQIAGLLGGEAAPLSAVRVVSHLDLIDVVQPAFEPRLSLLYQHFAKPLQSMAYSSSTVSSISGCECDDLPYRPVTSRGCSAWGMSYSSSKSYARRTPSSAQSFPADAEGTRLRAREVSRMKRSPAWTGPILDDHGPLARHARTHSAMATDLPPSYERPHRSPDTTSPVRREAPALTDRDTSRAPGPCIVRSIA